MRVVLARLVVLWVAVVGAGCAEDFEPRFRCAGDSAACVNAGLAGTCEPTGYCSFPDASCASGRRYGAYAGEGRGDSCVEEDCPTCGAGEICLTQERAGPGGLACCPPTDCLPVGARAYGEAARATTPPVLDGSPSEWAEVPRVAMAQWPSGTAPAAADFRAQFSVLWDEQGLYVFVEATDDHVVPPDSGDAYWDDDSSEVFVDLDPRDTSIPLGPNEDHFFLTQGDQVYEAAELDYGWQASCVFGSSGGAWWFELFFPWPAPYGPPRPGDVIGFDVGADDDDGESADHTRSDNVFWSDGTGAAWHDASTFGLLRLLP